MKTVSSRHTLLPSHVIDRLIGKWRDGQKEGSMGGWTDGQTDGWTAKISGMADRDA